MLVIQYWTTL